MPVHLVMSNPQNRGQRIRIDNAPSPTILAKGIYSAFLSQYVMEIEVDEITKIDIVKPPYVVPTMEEVRNVPWNGLKVASTFSGCGGSCLGYRMAGMKVVWANEFVPAAQDSYRANMSEGCVLDPRDIKRVSVNEILAATGLAVGELDIFDGSPPCQAFSMAGKRSKGWGTDREYDHGAKQKNETLFDEYIRLLRGLKPKVFIAENVGGLVKGVAKGFFINILAELKASGYNVKAKLLDAQWLGVPQMRQRVIFIGVRNDIYAEPTFPTPLGYFYSVKDALPDIDRIDGVTFNATVQEGAFPSSRKSAWEASPPIMAGRTTDVELAQVQSGAVPNRMHDADSSPSPSIMAALPTDVVITKRSSDGPKVYRRKFTIDEIKRLCSFPEDFVLTGNYAQQWERLGNSVPPLMMKAIASAVRDGILLKKG